MKIAILFTLIAAASAGQTFLQELAARGIGGVAAPVFAHGGFAHAGLAHGGFAHSGLAHGGFAHGRIVSHGGLVNGGFTAPAVGVSHTGSSVVNRADDGIGNYRFAYQEQGATGGSARSESGDVYGRKQGSYSLGVVDGRQRTVNYVADEFGFRAQVNTNEPGTAAQAPADVAIAAAPQAVAHVAPQVAAPVAVARPIVQTVAHAPVFRASYAVAPQVHVAAPQVYARPIVQQPIVQHVAVPRPTAYSSAVSHVAAAPAIHAAPVVQASYGVAPQVHVKSFAAPIVQQPIVQQVAIPRPTAYSSVVSHVAAAPAIHAAPVVQASYGVAPQVHVKSFAAPIVQQPIVQQVAIPRPTAYSSVVSHVAAAPAVHTAPVLQSSYAVAPQVHVKSIAAAPIVQQPIVQHVAVPRPTAYSSVVSHVAAAPAYHAAHHVKGIAHY